MSEGALKCPDCGKEGFKHQGALNLHRSVHCPNKKPKPAEQQEEMCEDGSICDFQLLNPRDPRQAKARAAGYKEVCVKCLTVR